MTWDKIDPAETLSKSPFLPAKAMDLGWKNMSLALKLGEGLAQARSASDIVTAVTSYNREVFETLAAAFGDAAAASRETVEGVSSAAVKAARKVDELGARV